MHPSLHLDDIQRLVFESLEPRDLARLAQTCKVFFHIATDELWKTINSFSPFLSCLPQDFQYCYRKLQVEDLHRYVFYLPKIRNLFLESRAAMLLPPPFQSKPKNRMTKHNREKKWEELWEEIAKLRPISELLSNLRRLRISNVEERLLVPLIGISGSNLTQIHIDFIRSRQTQSVVLKVLDGIKYTPKLESLFVRDQRAHLLDLIRPAPLKHLRLDPRIRCYEPQYNQSPLPHEILQKSALQTLTLRLTREWYTPEIKALNSKYLPALEKLLLNLTEFEPRQCVESCVNTAANSWTCKGDKLPYSSSLHRATNCGRRSPTVFFKGLDNPELSLLYIKFPTTVTGRKFLDVMSAASDSCRLGKLTELVLAGGGWFPHCWECVHQPFSQIPPADLRTGLNMLLPLHQLRILQLRVAPNFLDILDLKLYRSIAAGLPALEELTLRYADFYVFRGYGQEIRYERVFLHHIAAFCSMLPNIKDVRVGGIDGLTLEERPRKEWACVGVESLRISHYTNITQPENLRLLLLSLELYFPNSGLDEYLLSRREYTFNSEN
ncbi:hypothetical protein OIDMADRAFT_56385 [Oidiodendron maius Zn]|uniref:F-box domain-containing protein n=1 Tax=Oidiodendron maius (strain Zn) TaxID=913774 RepID=A0A0C3DBC3_OIDMZ|nr:hypothetical protein OIDMADRAFT_56385 [Oidiodendron maius Zn]